MTLVPTDEKVEKFEEIWSKIKALTKSTNNNSDEYDGNMKIKFNSDDETLKLMT